MVNTLKFQLSNVCGKYQVREIMKGKEQLPTDKRNRRTGEFNDPLT
jgi:hypothetical protein